MKWWTGYVIDFDKNIEDDQMEEYIHGGITGSIILSKTNNSESYMIVADWNSQKCDQFIGYGFDCVHVNDYCIGPNGENGTMMNLMDESKIITWTESSVLEELKNAINLSENTRH